MAAFGASGHRPASPAEAADAAPWAERLADTARQALLTAPRSAADTHRAVEACLAAAYALQRTGAVDRAAGLLADAVAVSPRAEPTGPCARLLVDRARAVLACGRLAEARPLFSEAAAVAEAAGDHLAFADAALGRGGIWLNEHRSMADADHVVGLQRRALALLPPSERSLRLRLEARLVAEDAYRRGAIEPASDLVEQARQLDDPGARGEVLSHVHHLLLAPRHAHRRVALADELIAVASEANQPLLLLLGQCWRTVDLFLIGDPRAERMHAALRRRTEALGVEAIGFVADAMDVMRLVRAGRLEDAERAADRCFARGTAAGDADALAWYGSQIVAIRWLQGRAAEVLSAVEEFASSPTLSDCEFGYVAAAASIAAACGQTEQARAALDRLTARGLASLPESSTWLTTMFVVADAARALGDAGAAREVFELLNPYAELPVMPSLAVVCFGSTQRALGIAALTFGDVELAILHLEAAVRANRRLGNRPFAAIAAADLADALLRRDRDDDREQAVALLRSAACEANRIGMRVYSTRWTEQAATAERPVGTIHARGARWLVALGGEQVIVPDRVGMRHLITLVRSPGVELSALALTGGRQSSLPPERDCVLDDTALVAYRKRIDELREKLGEADRLGLPERSAQAQAELDALVEHLAAATGHRGRARSFPHDDERARTAVTKAIRRVVDEISATCPDLGAHLRESIVTGQRCRYAGSARWIVTTVD